MGKEILPVVRRRRTIGSRDLPEGEPTPGSSACAQTQAPDLAPVQYPYNADESHVHGQGHLPAIRQQWERAAERGMDSAFRPADHLGTPFSKGPESAEGKQNCGFAQQEAGIPVCRSSLLRVLPPSP